MPHASYFREKASQCRRLIDVAVVPEVIEQMEDWAEEFDEKASRIEERTAAAESPAAEPVPVAGPQRRA